MNRGLSTILFSRRICKDIFRRSLSDFLYYEFEYPKIYSEVRRNFVEEYRKNDLTPRLKTINHIADGLPKGEILLDLEKTDMKKAKEILGDRVCLLGKVPSAVLVYGTPEDVEKYCRKLIEDCAEGGGFVLSTECETARDSEKENVRAIVEAAEKYGVY